LNTLLYIESIRTYPYLFETCACYLQWRVTTSFESQEEPTSAVHLSDEDARLPPWLPGRRPGVHIWNRNVWPTWQR